MESSSVCSICGSAVKEGLSTCGHCEAPLADAGHLRPSAGQRSASTAAPPDLPSIPGCVVLRLLGSGGMGSVWLARDETLGRQVAVKLMSEQFWSDPTARARFLREARAMATVEHPHIARLYSLGEVEGRPYAVMEYVEGETLAGRLQREGPLPEHEALRIAHQVAEALQAAWGKHLVHRDVKPANILLDSQGRVRVVDFGLARPAELAGGPLITQAGGFLGTPHYVSPEQARGGSLDFRVDVYSLGIVLYEMLAGYPPFDGDCPLDVIDQHLHSALPPLREKRLDVSEGFERLVEWMTHKDPQQRPASYAGLLRQLEAPSAVASEAPGAAGQPGRESRPGAPASPAPALERGREAASRGDWQSAYELLREADTGQSLGAADLPLLADVAYAAGHLEVTFEAWERAHAQSLRAGDRMAAAGAAARIALHLLMDTALQAPLRGWTRRAERLLEGQAETPIHAVLAVLRCYERMFSGDFKAARRWAEQAIDLGSRFDPVAAAIGRVAEARSLIFEGEVRQGLELLNEAAVCVVSGELDPVSSGIVYCEIVCGLQGLAQYDLAEEWTDAMERWRHGQPVGSIHGHCRIHRAEILRLRGSTGEAEKQALLACEELRPYLRRELGWPLTELGRIRLQKGDLRGAEEAFLAAHQVGWDPQPGLALVYLARGDVELAAASIRNAVENPLKIPSKELPPNTALRQAPLLEAMVEISLAAGDLDRARWAAEQLAPVAARFESKPLAASEALARARVHQAQGRTMDARQAFETALELWNEVGAPYEAAITRLGLAQAHRAEGNEEAALLEFRAARSAFEQVGALHHAERAARACGDAGVVGRAPAEARKEPEPTAQAPGHQDGVAQQLHVFRRDGELWSVTFQAHTSRLPDGKGMQYLARLLASPGRELHVLELVGSAVPENFGSVLDTTAKEACWRRLADIDEDIEAARAAEDTEREVQGRTERDLVAGELSRMAGPGSPDRRTSSASESARASVTREVRVAMDRIREQNPQFAEHLARSIRTGTYCGYLPDPQVPMA